MKRFLLVTLVMLAAVGCHRNEPAAGNEAGANISSVDANSMPEDANITDIPADDGDAPAPETNAQ